MHGKMQQLKSQIDTDNEKKEQIEGRIKKNQAELAETRAKWEHWKAKLDAEDTTAAAETADDGPEVTAARQKLAAAQKEFAEVMEKAQSQTSKGPTPAEAQAKKKKSLEERKAKRQKHLDEVNKADAAFVQQLGGADEAARDLIRARLAEAHKRALPEDEDDDDADMGVEQRST